MQNPRFDRRRRPNYWSTVQLYGKMLHPNVAKPNVQSRCRLCVRSELADLTSTKRIVFASKLETHQRTPAIGSSIHRSKRIDLIITADLMASLILPGTRIGNADEPIAQNSHLGWMTLGKFQDSIHTFNIRCHQTALDTELLLKNFCEIESVPSRSLHSDEERWCESFFKETHTRQLNGIFMVRLPFKWNFDPAMALGKSHQVALNRFLQLERRYQRDPDKWDRYKEGIEEYFELGQITHSERSTVSTSTKRSQALRVGRPSAQFHR